MARPITPDPEDIAAIDAELGALPSNATDQQCAERYRLAQARKANRLHDHGRLPVEAMRAMDRLKRTK